MGEDKTKSLDLLDELLVPVGALEALGTAQVPRDHWIGKRLGEFHVTELIGAGGMSAVYRAQRVDGQFEQTVAIKFLHMHVDSPGAQQRLLLERQILANLSHPNIAHLIDGGVSSDGAPYLVMELIDGLPIDQHALRYRLDISQRLDLFAQVLGALDHAHANAVIHRDIKPSNILVSRDGVVKLLDFGIAKILAPDADQTERLLTVRYASPEQLRGDRVSTASDIYLAGIVLYELLTGCHPFAAPNATQSQVITAIENSTPQAPSKAAQAAMGRRSSGRLRGDLDTIILKCLKHDPAQRYASSRELLDDINAWRQSRPISARGGNLRYVMGRFVARHRMAAAVAGVSVAMLVGLAAFAIIRVNQERQTAITRAESAERIQSLTQQIFKMASPYGSESTADKQELLAAWESEVNENLAAEPATQAQLLYLLGTARSQLGDLDGADRVLRQAMEIADKDAKVHIEIRMALADIAMDRSQEAEAELLLGQAAGNWPPETIAAWELQTGSLKVATSRLSEALAHFEQAVAIYESLVASGKAPEKELVLALTQLARANVIAGKAKPALSLVNRVFIDGQAPPLQGLELADALDVYGRVLDMNRQCALARDTLMQSLALRQDRLTPNHPQIAESLAALGLTHRHLGNYAQSLAFHEQADQIFASAGMELSSLNLANRMNWASTYDDMGKIEESVQIMEALREAYTGTDFSNYCKVLNNLGNTYVQFGRISKAEVILMEARRCKLDVFGPDASTTGNTLMSLADVRMQLGRTDEVESLIAEGHRIRADQFGVDSFRLAYPYDLQGEYLSQTGQHEKALWALNKSLQLRLDHGEEGSLHFSQTMLRRAHAFVRMGNGPAALADFDQAVGMLTESFPYHPVTLQARFDRMTVYFNMNRPLPDDPEALQATVREHVPYRTDLIDALRGADFTSNLIESA